MHRQRKRPPRCPRCRGVPSRFLEFTSAALGWQATPEGWAGLKDEGYTDPGYPECVDAVCGACGHQWRLRGVWQITDLHKEKS